MMLAFKIFPKVMFALIILQMQCESKKIHLDKEDLNVRLTGHVFWTRNKMEDLPTCARRCIEYKKCKSINFSIKYKICELNLVKKSPENQCDLKRNVSFINMDIDIWPKVGNDPCFNRPCTEKERCINNGGWYVCSKIAPPKNPSSGPATSSSGAPITSAGLTTWATMSTCPLTSSSAVSTSLTSTATTTSTEPSPSSSEVAQTPSPTWTTTSTSQVRIRLSDGGQNYGRVEVKYNGIWGTVCKEKFRNNNNAASVVCRSLGFSAGEVLNYTLVGTGPIWLDNVICNGNETSLFECSHRPWGEYRCDHSKDVGVQCHQ